MSFAYGRSALLGSGAAFILATAATAASAADTLAQRRAQMQQQIEQLERRLTELEARKTDARRMRRVAPAAAVEAGSRKRTWKLPGTNISMRIGGFAQLDLIYDINAFSGDGLSSDGASGGSFPSKGSAAANRQGNFRLMARRSRFYIRTWTPTDFGTLETRIEGDFFGTGGNQLISNSNSFRLRHAYGKLGPLLAGQTNSNFRFSEFEPRFFEDRGPAGLGGPRQGLVQYTHSFGGGTELAVSVENPETGRAATSTAFVGGTVAVSGAGANDRVPDFAVSLRHKWSSGIVRIAGLFGERGIEDGAGTNGRDTMWGVQAGLVLAFNNKRTKVGIVFFYGEGIGRYFRGQPAEVAVSGLGSSSESVNSVRNYGGYAWIRHQWTNTLQTNLMYGRNNGDVEQHIAKALIPANTLDVHWTVHANIVWEPIRDVALALEYIFAKSQFHNAAAATVHRIQMTARYNF